jgi:uncharacterized membrane protein YeaQ/YmgE (transglycosylase-associated protein family)
MGILSWLVVGLIAGWLAGKVTTGRGYGLLGDLITGVVGAVIGGYLAAKILGMADPISGINLNTIVVATVGAILLTLVLRLLRR